MSGAAPSGKAYDLQIKLMVPAAIASPTARALPLTVPTPDGRR
jgi:hypothetical protein